MKRTYLGLLLPFFGVIVVVVMMWRQSGCIIGHVKVAMVMVGHVKGVVAMAIIIVIVVVMAVVVVVVVGHIQVAMVVSWW